MEKCIMDLNELERFIVARWAYSVNNPIMNDFEYTALLNYVTKVYPDNEYLKRSWSSDPCPTDLLKRIKREDLIASVIIHDKTESIPSLNSELEVQSELGSFDGFGTLSMKHDGWNIQFNYYNGALLNVTTRGRTYDAMKVDQLAANVPNSIPIKGSVKIVAEATISKTNFTFCAREFGNANPRSAVHTVLSRPEYISLINLHAVDIHGVKVRDKFSLLEAWGFKVPKYYIVNNFEDIQFALKQLSDEAPVYDSPTDGVVFDGDVCRAIRLLNWHEPVYYSFVTGYDEKFNMYRISPSLKIYPVLRDGTVQTQINITNWQRILSYQLKPGAPVAFRIAASAIADFDEDATNLLLKELDGDWADYQEKVKMNEEVKRIQWNQSCALSE